jgi:hypothetical protein
MPRLVPYRLAAACALALVLLLSVAVAASGRATQSTAGKAPTVQLRVIGAGGKVLAEKLASGVTTSIRTSRKANCLGRGTGGSGRAVKIQGATALGVLARASKSTAALRPLLLTDHFLSEFGLGLCGIGRSRATKTLSWYLKVNHKNPQRGGEQAKVRNGDEVLWALEPFPYPEELSLVAPFSAQPGVPFEVTVFSYDDKGKKRPAAGATVTGASGPTDANGHASVTLTEAQALVARRGKDIPSNSETVVMCAPDRACPVP